MSKLFKKIVSVMLIIIVMLCSVPAESLLNINFSVIDELFFNKANAADIDVEIDTDIVEVDFDMYKTELISGERNVSECEELVNWLTDTYAKYTSTDYISTSTDFVDSVFNSPFLCYLLMDWEKYSAVGQHSDAFDQVLDQVDYCEILILEALGIHLEKNFLTKALENKLLKSVTEMTSVITEELKWQTVAEMTDGAGSYHPALGKLVEDVFPIGKASEHSNFLCDVLKYAKDISEVVDKIHMYATLYMYSDEISVWLRDMRNCAPVGPMRDAFDRLILSCEDAIVGAITNSVLETTETLGSWIASFAVTQLKTALCMSHPAVAAVFIGFTAGTVVSNALFATDDVCEQLYFIKYLSILEETSRKAVLSTEGIYDNDKTKENAQRFLKTFGTYFTIIGEMSADYMIKIYNSLYNKGYVNNHKNVALKWFGIPSGYDDAVSCMENMKKIRMLVYEEFDKLAKVVYNLEFVKEEPPVEIPPEDLEIELEDIFAYLLTTPGKPSGADLYVGDSSEIRTSLTPENTTQTAYTITSLNPSVVHIIDNCIAVGVDEGTATIMVTSAFNNEISYSFPVTVKAQQVEAKIEDFYYSVISEEEKTITITGVTDKDFTKIEIPSVINGYTVYSIDNGVFFNLTSLEYLSIPDTVKDIGEGAFYNCVKLETIEFSGLLHKIGKAAFYNCRALNDISECNVAILDKLAFYNCDRLTEYDLAFDKGDVYFGEGVFGNCNAFSKLTSHFVLAAQGTAITTRASGITLADSINRIDNTGYYGWRYLLSVTIPDSVKTIGTEAFTGSAVNHIFYTGTQSQWNSIYIYSNNQTISKATKHYSASNNNNVYISESLEPTCLSGGYDIVNCNICHQEIGKVTIPAINHIGKKITTVAPTCKLNKGYTLYYCLLCNEYYKDDFVDPIGQHNFENESCTVCGVPKYLKYWLRDETVEILGLNYEVEKVHIPKVVEGLPVTSIWSGAFKDCSLIKYVELPNNLRTIGAEVFSGCTNLISIALPNTVTDMYSNVFYNCTSLEEIILSNRISSLGDQVFYNCESLQDILIPQSVVSIGERAFYGCKSIKSIVIPDGVTDIDINAFEGCMVEDVVLGDSLNSIPTSIVNKATLKTFVMGDSITHIRPTQFSGCKNLTDFTFGKGPVSIGSGAFSGCSSMQSIYAPDIESWLKIYFGSGSTNCEYPMGYGAKIYFGGNLVTDIVIPEGITTINSCAFAYFYDLVSITFPSSIKKVGDGAFKYCSNLKYVNTTDLSAWCQTDFYSNPCSETGSLYVNGVLLEELVIPEDVTDIGIKAFAGCRTIASITFHDNIKSIGANAFDIAANNSKINISDFNKWCKIKFENIYSNPLSSGADLYLDGTLLEEAVFSDDTTSVNDFVLAGAESITSVSLPSGLIDIGSYAFSGCINLVDVNIPESVKTIPEHAFENCSSLIRIALPSGLTGIGSYAFKNCTNLVDVNIPESVKTIGEHAFEYCNSLTRIAIPSEVSAIDRYVFYKCENLFCVTFPKGLTSIGYYAFSETGLKNILYSGTQSQWDNVTIDYGNTELSSAVKFLDYDGSEIVIAEGKCTEKIDWKILADGVIKFEGEGNMPDYSYSSDEPWYPYKDKIRMVTFSGNITGIGANSFCYLNIVDATIPDSVTYIGDSAFAYCYNLVAVSMGNGIERIGSSAFSSCKNLKSVNIPNSVVTVDSYAFNYCENLEEVFIGSGVTSLSDSAISSCKKLKHINVDENNDSFASQEGILFNKDKSVLIKFPSNLPKIQYDIPDTVTTIGKSAFYNCDSLTDVTIPNSVTVIGETAFSSCDSLTDVTLPDSVTVIGDYAFSYCKKFNNISLPDSIEEIGWSVLYNTPYYNDAENWSDGILYIGKYLVDTNSSLTGEYSILPGTNAIAIGAFSDCSNLTKVTIPDSITNIPDSAFSDCSNLTDVYIPDSVINIGEKAFYECSSLTTVTIPKDVKKIEYATFYGCTNLKSVTLPYYIEIIEDSAFYNCTSLEDVFFSGSESQWDNILFDSGNNSLLYASNVHFNNNFCNHKNLSYYDEKLPSCTTDGNTAGTYCNDCKSWIIMCKTLRAEHIDINVDNICDICGECASDIMPGQTKTIEIKSDEITYLKFIPLVSGVYTFESISNKDTHGYLFDSNKEVWSSLYDGGDFSIGCELEAGQTYYWGASFYSGIENGYIDVVLTCDEVYCNHKNTTFHPESNASCTIDGYTAGIYCNDCERWIDGHKTLSAEHTDTDSNNICDICGECASDIMIGVTKNIEIKSDEITYLKFIPEVSGIYIFDSNSSEDTYGYLFDANKEQLSYNDDGGNGSNFSIVYSLTAGETYYWGARFYSSSKSGFFNVTLTLQEICKHEDAEIDSGMVATCISGGYTAGKYCYDCDEWIEGHEYIDELGHNYSSSYTTDTAATCTTDGSKSKHCTRNGCTAKTDVTEIAKLAHSESKITGKAATCSKAGLSDGKKCDVCGTVTLAQKTIAKKAHSYDNACDAECNTCSAKRTITHSYKNVTTKATLTKNGKVENKCSVCGTVKSTTTVYYPKTIKLSKTDYTYNGKVQTSSVTVKDSKGNNLKKDTDYTVKYSDGRKNTGKYTVTITFKGKYSGTKKLAYNILPSKTSKITPTCGTTSIKASWKKVIGASGYKVELLNSKGKVVKTVTTAKTAYTFEKLSKVTTYKIRVTAYKTIDSKKVCSTSYTTITTSTAPAKVTLSKVSAGSKSATPTWKKVSGASGYEVMYSTSSKFSSSKTATVSKGSSTKTTIKKLAKGKKYYFKVRAYKTVDGKKVYGAWSAAKSVKVK